MLDLIAPGSTNREIAAALHLSPHTVNEHTSGLYRKLGARNRAEAVQRAHRAGLRIDRRAEDDPADGRPPTPHVGIAPRAGVIRARGACTPSHAR